MSTFEESYSALDRAVHRLAFANRTFQLAAADMESTFFAKRFRHISVDRPVFVTSLPRAGTTLLLEVLSRLPGFVSHRYRDMPFVLAPLLWTTFSRSFRRQAGLRERAHGDGMNVGYDSPEAFEEILWRFAWPSKFTDSGIRLWSGSEDPGDFRKLFTEHMQKLVASRGGAESARYISKNNANISRIPFLSKLFREGTILVPFRHPVDQAQSLLTQHRRFVDIHAKEEFSRRYMEDIGHFEFGALHRPIQFEGLQEATGRYSKDSLEYWMAYWMVAFTHVLRFKDDVVLLCYEKCCEDFGGVASAIAGTLGIETAELLAAGGDSFRPPKRYQIGNEIRDRDLLDRALRIHAELQAVSLV